MLSWQNLYRCVGICGSHEVFFFHIISRGLVPQQSKVGDRRSWWELEKCGLIVVLC
jgi:hypothetical protein